MRVLLKELLRGDRFDLELDGVSAAGFVSCSGLQSRREVLEYREEPPPGGLPQRVCRRSGRVPPPHPAASPQRSLVKSARAESRGTPCAAPAHAH